jgi:uncharacterized repeat protein (TIGR01451 family)
MKKLLLSFLIALSVCTYSQSTCSNALAFCDSVVFPSTVNALSAQIGPDYGCLGSQPNCSWFYTQINVPGNIDISLSAANDVDFICWGPFSSLANVCNSLSAGAIVDCSYSSSATETLNIVNAVTGKYYVFLTTNFSNQSNPILIKKIGGNGNTCSGFNGINGYVYKDLNNNCINNLSDQPLFNVPVKLYDNIGNLLIQTNTNIYGQYWFSQVAGTYSIVVDTVGTAVTSLCQYPGLDSLITLTPSYTVAPNVDFSLGCSPGFDIGVSSVVSSGIVFPAHTHNLHVNAGNMSNWYNLNCPANTPGTVQISINGLMTYLGPAAGALVPTSTLGNLFTYSIPNFSNINPSQDFNLILHVDTNAVAGNSICVSVTVTPTVGDVIPLNNTFQYCYDVTNSFDPNYKETYPENVAVGYMDWFYYTIHFQNTGSATALNIKLLDTLSTNLDLSTFRITNYSHPVIGNLTGNNLELKFQNINLPDSTSNAAGSMAFVQYKLKPKPNLAGGTQIKNRAHIYFDFNPPIATNTSTNTFLFVTGIKSQNSTDNILVYPNPSDGIFNLVLKTNSDIQIEVYNSLGQLILKDQLKNGNSTIDISKAENGIYILKTFSKKESNVYRIIKQ